MSRTRISATSCMSYENAHALHSLQLINLSAFAEHLTRQFPVVGGPRAFAQPNNFDHGAEALRSMIQVFFVRLSLANR